MSGEPYVSPDGIVQQGVTEIDVDSLASAAGWLDGLRSYIQTHLIPDTATMTITKDMSDLYFGLLDSSGQVAGVHSSYVKTAIESYRTVAQSLYAASQATADIVKNYKDVERSNAVTAQNIDAAFAAAAGTAGSSPGGVPPATTTSTGAGDQAHEGRFR